MSRFRLPLVALCTLALASVASATTPTATPSSAGIPDNRLAQPAPADPPDCTETIDPAQTLASGSFCNKICAIGFRCNPTPNGGVCVPDNGLTDPAPADPTNSTPVAPPQRGVDLGIGVDVAASDASDCGACTILCPYPLHLVQTKNCVCKCVGGKG